MAKVILLCGKIASGKTTYANLLTQRGKAVTLSCDDLMLTLFDQCLGEKHDETVERCKRFFYVQAEQILAVGADAVFDFGFWTKSERTDTKEYFRQKGIPCELHYLTIPEKLRLERLEKRNRALAGAKSRVYIISPELREYLDAKFEEPSTDEIDKLIDIERKEKNKANDDKTF